MGPRRSSGADNNTHTYRWISDGERDDDGHATRREGGKLTGVLLLHEPRHLVGELLVSFTTRASPWSPVRRPVRRATKPKTKRPLGFLLGSWEHVLQPESGHEAALRPPGERARWPHFFRVSRVRRLDLLCFTLTTASLTVMCSGLAVLGVAALVWPWQQQEEVSSPCLPPACRPPAARQKQPAPLLGRVRAACVAARARVNCQCQHHRHAQGTHRTRPPTQNSNPVCLSETLPLVGPL